jgi:hypothetical protein
MHIQVSLSGKRWHRNASVQLRMTMTSMTISEGRKRRGLNENFIAYMYVCIKYVCMYVYKCKRAVEDDDDEYDDFGRKEKKRH